MPPGTRASEALQHLALMKVAKDLFLSEWYQEAADKFFDGEERALMKRIAEESRQELVDTYDVVEQWTATVEHGESGGGSDGPAAVAHATRRDFLEMLVDSKEAAADVYMAAARSAPPELQERLAELGEVDLRHANLLRELLNRATEDQMGQDARPTTE